MVVIGRGIMEKPPVSDCADSPTTFYFIGSSVDVLLSPIGWVKVSNALVLHTLLVVYVRVFLSPMREIVSRKISKRQ